MDGARASLMATDPPYLVNYDGGNHPPTWANGGKKPGAPADSATKHWDSYVDHDTAVAFYEQYLSTAIEDALTTTPVIYMFFGMMRAPLVFEAWAKAGLLLHQVLVWNKSRIVLSRSDYCWNYEPIAYGWVKERGRGRRAARRPTQRRSGRSLLPSSTAPRNIPPASRSSSSPAPSTTTPSPARSSTNPSVARARRSSPPR